MKTLTWIALGLVAAGTSGCLPRTFVKKDPGPHDRGIRYYRPKPYLMVTPLEVAVTEGDDKTTVIRPQMVQIEQVMLPDYSEEYSIHIRSGLGVNSTQIKLEDGWNLTSLNAKLDSQFDENVKAISELVKAPLPGKGAESGSFRGAGGEHKSIIPAYDVPLGLYEAVLSTDPHGRKRMYGFRYVGFFPYAACPIESCGVQEEHCQSAVLYGLVYDERLKAMVFRELNELAVPRGRTVESSPSTTARATPGRPRPEATGKGATEESNRSRDDAAGAATVPPEPVPTPQPGRATG